MHKNALDLTIHLKGIYNNIKKHTSLYLLEYYLTVFIYWIALDALCHFHSSTGRNFGECLETNARKMTNNK